MIKRTWSAALPIFLLMAFLAQPLCAEPLRFELRVVGGLGRIDGGDLHTRLANLGSYWKALAELPGSPYEYSGKTGYPFRSAAEGTIEIGLRLNDRLSIALGAGYLHATRRSGEDVAIHLSRADLEKEWIYTVGSTVRAIPVTLTGRYDIPISDRQRLSLQAGAGYYPCRWTMPYDSRVSSNVGGVVINHVDYTATATGIGLHGGLGWEIDLSSRLALVVEALGRIAAIDGFSGSWKSDISGTGTMYFWEWYDSDTEAWYPTMDMYAETPSPGNKRNLRSARVDLSGVTVRIGVMIRL